MISEKLKIDKTTGEYFLPNAGLFLANQKKNFPNILDLYKFQLNEFLKTSSKEIRSNFSDLCQH